VSKRYPMLVLLMAFFVCRSCQSGPGRCAIVSGYTVGRKDAAIICHRRGIAQGSCPVSNSFLFWAGEHASSLADLQRRLLWHCGMDCQRQLLLSSESFLLLLLLICSEKGVLKVNCAEEIVEPNVGTKSVGGTKTKTTKKT
jgi:hypothetical protein